MLGVEFVGPEAWISAGELAENMNGCQDFNSSGTFNTVSCGLGSGDWVHVLAVGAGGGGPFRPYQPSTGGSGGEVCSQFYKFNSNSNVSVTIGSGGTPYPNPTVACSHNANNGGCTKFGNVCAQGGNGSSATPRGKNGGFGCQTSGCATKAATISLGGFGRGGGGGTAVCGGGAGENGTGGNGFVRVMW